MNKTQIKKKGDQMLEHLNDLVVDRFESIRAMETALNQKDQADDFDKKMEYCSFIAYLAKQIVKADDRHEAALEEMREFMDKHEKVIEEMECTCEKEKTNA